MTKLGNGRLDVCQVAGECTGVCWLLLLFGDSNGFVGNGGEMEAEKEKKRRNGKVVFFRCLQITGKRGIYITKVKRRVGGEAAVGTCNSR